MIDRRRFLQASAAGCCLAACDAPDQAPARVKVIGYLSPGQRTEPPQQFIDDLRRRGWFVGRNVVIEFRAPANADLLTDPAEELVRLKPDLIIADGTHSARAVRRATSTIPIVFRVGADPVRSGLVASFAKPGGNMTGFFSGEYDDKLLEVLKEAVPGITRVMFTAATPTDAAVRVAKVLKVDITGFTFRGPADLDAFYLSMKNTRANGLVIPNYPWVGSFGQQVAQRMIDDRTPAIAVLQQFVPEGGLLAYGPTNEGIDLTAQADAILRGANPADMPVEQRTHFRLSINLATAKTIGVTIPEDLLARADLVVRG